MNLRWRLALALGLLGATAVVLVATVAYAATSRQLRSETDDFLAARTEQVLAAARRQGPDHVFPGRDGFPAPPVGLGASVYQYDAVAQVIDADGSVAATAGKVPLPVDNADRALAASDSSRSRRRTTSLDGTPYRIQTTALSGGGALQIGRDVTEAERILDRLRIQLAAVGGIVTALAAAAGYLIARRTAAPVGRLTVAAEHVAATGDLDADLPAGGADETGRLAAAFTTMLERLAASRAQQQQLVQDASHELRTPLTSLRTNVEVLRRHPELGAEARQPILADLEAEARELADLVDELVELATDRRDDEATQDVDLGALADRVAARARRRTGRVVAVERAGAAVVSGQPQALERAVANLVDNAAKFSPEGTPIEIVVTGGRVEVRDHGSGIPDADRARVFDRFYRAAAARAQPGSGLGLAIVRQVAERHHGRVFAAGQPGGGAIVGFEVSTGAG